MNIRRYRDKKIRIKKTIKIKKMMIRKEGINMATISFERDIKLSPRAVRNLMKISNEPIKDIKRNTNAIQALNKGEEILKQLFSR